MKPRRFRSQRPYSLESPPRRTSDRTLCYEHSLWTRQAVMVITSQPGLKDLTVSLGRRYHVIFIPEYRRKTLYKELRRHLGEVFQRFAEQKQSGLKKAIC